MTKIRVSVKMKQNIEKTKKIPAHKRALIAHLLTSILENKQNENIEDLWTELAEKRLKAFEAGSVQTKSWSEIKKAIKSS
ncbi:MAG TPA: addiction module antitoxin RelB [Gammaproteobacteria bacterium]|nr:addiction module antitoxin RelB [Gammaproteobacteria bacterium]